jgi:TolB-like protein/Tfp pilus assembly protein PilF
MDVVGYSKLLLDEQRELQQQLTQVVRNTEQVRTAEAAGKLIRLPVGDGMALVFLNSPEAPVQCAIEIAKKLKENPELKLRMGIHSGPVNEVRDVNERTNVAGAGINIAQRVMDCGDAGHVLLSKRVAEDLGQSRQWQPYLHDLGECAVKHGVPIFVVNLYNDEVGNPELPEKFKLAQEEQAAAATASHRTPTLRRKHVIIVTSSLLIAAIGVGVWFYSRQATVTPSLPTKSIAVLPFENLSRDPDNAYFTEGVQDEILTRLAKIADLKVISRTSTQRFKSSPDNLPQIAKQLGVANILEGSVQKAADQVRVNVQLINAASDAHLWAESFDRKLTDIFAVESDIATTIAETLQAKLTGSEKTAIAKRPTENTEAYELYLKGRFFWNKRTGADLRTAIEYFNQALGKDPSYALAYAGLSDSYGLLSVFGAASPADSFPQAKAAAKKALELDDTLAEAHTSLANALVNYDFDFEQSLKEFERAIQLNPNYATAHHWLSDLVLLPLGQFDRAIAEGKRAVELDPLSLIINADLGQDYFNARRYDEASAQLRKTIEMDPRFYYAHRSMGQVWQLKGQLNGAIAQYRKAVELNDDPYVLALLGQAYARAGHREEAQKILARLNEEAKSRYVSAYSFALMYLALGDKERAIDEIERAYRERAGGDVGWIKVDPMLDDLRGNPRFEALVQKVLSGKQ